MGLGSALTTRQRRFEEELKSLLGIPDDVETAALLPLGFPIDGGGIRPHPAASCQAGGSLRTVGRTVAARLGDSTPPATATV